MWLICLLWGCETLSSDNHWSSKFSRCFSGSHIQTARRWAMAIENKTGEEFDTIFSLNDSLELSAHHDYETPQARIFKIIVIGDSNVGKTCLTYRFCGGTFLKNPEATIGVDFRERTLELDGESIKVRRPANTDDPHCLFSLAELSAWATVHECKRGEKTTWSLFSDIQMLWKVMTPLLIIGPPHWNVQLDGYVSFCPSIKYSWFYCWHYNLRREDMLQKENISSYLCTVVPHNNMS